MGQQTTKWKMVLIGYKEELGPPESTKGSVGHTASANYAFC